MIEKKQKPSLLRVIILFLVLIACMAGIGGGNVSNPFFLWCGVDMRNEYRLEKPRKNPGANARAVGH